MERSFLQRLVGVGTIKVCSGDKTMGDFEIKNIKRPKATKELLSDLVEKQRDIKRVVNRENMIDGHDHSLGATNLPSPCEAGLQYTPPSSALASHGLKLLTTLVYTIFDI